LLNKVQAIIREERLDAVIERLVLIGVRGLTIIAVKGAGRTGGRREVFRGSAYQVTFLPKVLLEWFGPEQETDAVVRAIAQRACTGKLGDGKIFVQAVEEAVRIRTGERGTDAV
jgi:nitrogen regulatory protein P-II 1